MKHTQGIAVLSLLTGDVVSTGEFKPKDGGDIICCPPETWDQSMLRWDENAALIIEAFNVAHETGKAPKQLAEINSFLLSALGRCKAQIQIDGEIREGSETHRIILAAIENSK